MSSANSARLHFDLGIPKLLSEWKLMLSPKYFWEDTVAAVTVICVAIPLGLSSAIAAGVHPELGLVTAIIGSFALGFLGGSPLAIGGPSPAVSMLLSSDLRIQILR